MGQIRITGGTHRSRKITVEQHPGLRPTTDRVRETLFNWLGQNLTGWSVLDLYAGSGILAFEAASRGAQSVDCVDNNRQVIQQLKRNADTLKLNNVNALLGEGLTYLQNTKNTYDLVFLDPPFDSNELDAINVIISDAVNPTGLVYREYAVSQDIAAMDDSLWQLKKHKKAGQVIFELWQKNT